MHDAKSVPGVGSYDINEGAMSRNGVIIGQKLSNAKDNKVPGAGAYEADQSPIKYQTPSFSISKKLVPYLQKLSPGPGTYQ